MIANALFAATALVLALLFFLVGQLRFLAPYRLFLIHQYGTTILLDRELNAGRTAMPPHLHHEELQ